jgi:YidC/Oxa1 family membrane protein insertase
VDRNAFLAFALSFLVLSVWMMWEAERRPRPAPTAAAPGEPEGGPLAPAEAPPAVLAAPSEPAAVPEPESPAETIEVENTLVHALLSSRGAGIVRLELRAYHEPVGEGGAAVALFDTDAEAAPAFATPLPELGLGDLGRAIFDVVERDARRVSFELSRGGVTVRKTYAFEEDSYRLRLRLELENRTAAALEPSFGVELVETVRPESDFRDLALIALVDGEIERAPVAGFGTPGFFGSLLGGGIERERRFAGNVEWVGGDSNYFVAAIVPDVSRDAQGVWTAVEPGKVATATVARPASLLPGTSLAREYVIYAGPKEPERLAGLGVQLERSIQLGYSWVAPLTRAFNWLLDACYRVIPNYGVAIIVLTVLVRLATAPLAAKQMRSMKRLGELQPKMREIQERFREDRQRQSQEMMKLYRESGVNPLGGCLPMVLQIPVFIGLYYALQSSIALRQAPFVLWIDDLSRPETLFTVPGLGLPVRLLPILMCLSMVVQQKMTPTTTMDPAQQRMMLVMMPLMFGFLFYTFPSGLVLYWFVSNLLAIGQQVLMNRQVAASAS